MEEWYANVQAVTERFLTWRKIRRDKKIAKQQAKHPVVDWLEAFLWAACVVLLINQYLFQAYQIPSGSMETTLLIKDRIFVNKMIFGPELLPGQVKIPGFKIPQRDEVIIFESPTYISKGPVFDILQRILYMVTLSIVDIDRDENGQPKAHFLIKRAIGVGKDRIRIVKGEVEYRFPGETDWVPERQVNHYMPVNYTTRRMVDVSEYKNIRLAGMGDGYADSSLPLTNEQQRAAGNNRYRYIDSYAWMGYRYEALHSIAPNNRKNSSSWRETELGWYIPAGWIFPMGDNRDNSRDARYFGPVRLKNVLGKAMFKYWPFHRIGRIY